MIAGEPEAILEVLEEQGIDTSSLRNIVTGYDVSQEAQAIIDTGQPWFFMKIGQVMDELNLQPGDVPTEFEIMSVLDKKERETPGLAQAILAIIVAPQ